MPGSCRNGRQHGYHLAVTPPVKRVALLLVMGLAVIGAAALVIRQAVKPKPVAIAERPPKREPALPPGRTLPPPSSKTPAKVERRFEQAKEAGALPGSGEGLVMTLTITTPIFDITRRYRSMEGPYADYGVRLDAGGVAPAARELWWWKGARIEVLDAQDKPIGQEFMCHLNVDVNPDERGRTVGLRPGSRRLLTLTQGELAFALPKGHGLPVASDETWNLMFQVLNHNRDGAFGVKQRLTLYFVRDADLFAPIDPVNGYAGSIWVPVERASPEALAFDKTTCHCCAPLERGLEATNNIAAARLVDDAGRTLVGHWVVPPGKSAWSYPMARYIEAADKPRRLYATWTHVHPFASEARLIAHAPGCEPEVVTKSTVESLRDGRVGLVSVRSLASVEGVVMPAGASFELAVDYDNSSGRAQDSMASLGMFVETSWDRPEWAARAQNPTDMDGSCGLQQ